MDLWFHGTRGPWNQRSMDLWFHGPLARARKTAGTASPRGRVQALQLVLACSLSYDNLGSRNLKVTPISDIQTRICGFTKSLILDEKGQYPAPLLCPHEPRPLGGQAQKTLSKKTPGSEDSLQEDTRLRRLSPRRHQAQKTLSKKTPGSEDSLQEDTRLRRLSPRRHQAQAQA
ncbi:hypothetical protein NHX12_020330 [Muraenolepis orangiensis]|uniref:Uncharacterized protein n=1 Tax=Muraenolepis orangiensis TaxID=630683 RepID=A0A9Q0ETA6_9TELE|nr:hypothetical protein NHX12_020330 [Muraenolepis orangiensis]